MNILLIRTSAIGDVVMASGLVPALKRKYPDAKITWLVEPPAAGLLRENELLDRVELWDKKAWVELYKSKSYSALRREIWRFRKKLRAQKFDIAIDAQGIFKSSFLAWLSGAKIRLGVGKKEGSWLFNTKTIEKDENNPDMCSEYRALAEHLEVDDQPYEMHLPYSDQTAKSVSRLLAEKIGEGERYIVICPFTTRPQKHWFDEHWCSLIDRLENQYKCSVVILGGPGDTVHAEQLLDIAPIPLINMVGKTSLLEAVAIIDQAKLVVGVDTGLTHIGIAKQTPTLALFGSTRPYLNPIGDRAKVLYDQMHCSPCRRNPTCGGDFTCMKNLTAERVMSALKGLVE